MGGMQEREDIANAETRDEACCATTDAVAPEVTGPLSPQATLGDSLPADIPHDTAERDAFFMRVAMEQARMAAEAGEVPIGAVVVYEPIDRGTRRPTAPPRVIALGRNSREETNDPTGHAELIAMRRAAEALDNWRLTDCTVYVTLEPCIMCAGLMHQARVSRCVYGAADRKAGALGTLYAINEDERLNHRFDVTPGVLEEECAALLSDFFKARR